MSFSRQPNSDKILSHSVFEKKDSVTKHDPQKQKDAIEQLNGLFKEWYEEKLLQDHYYLTPYKTYPVVVEEEQEGTLRLKRYTCVRDTLKFIFSKIPNVTTRYEQGEGSDLFTISSTDNFEALLNQLKDNKQGLKEWISVGGLRRR